ncbi:unnamed protein product [Moneuplotes crassus]|uniref:Uncharacterized protein n=1 Tax=Euplotes crassus TaxID=5936 RepID=A0AAD2D547_EUPCR|nr:unnamed protein product [Moneuplotes crassus]
MSFEGLKDLDLLIREEISSIDKIASTARENSTSTIPKNKNHSTESNLLYPPKTPILTPCTPSVTQSREGNGSMNIEITKKEGIKGMFEKCKKKPLREIQNLTSPDEEDRIDSKEYDVFYEVEEEEEEVDDYIDRLNNSRSDTLKKSSQNSFGVKSKDKDHLKVKTNSNNGSYHFIGSSFGKNSIPALKECMKEKQKLQKSDPIVYENKMSEEVKLNDTLQYSQEPQSSEKGGPGSKSPCSSSVDAKSPSNISIQTLFSQLQYLEKAPITLKDLFSTPVNVNEPAQLHTLYEKFKTVPREVLFKQFVINQRQTIPVRTQKEAQVSDLTTENLRLKHEISTLKNENARL